MACLLAWPPAQRRRTGRRLDGGCGPEAPRNGALWHGEQVRATGDRGKRAQAFARAGPPWEARRPGARGMAPAPTPRRSERRTQTVGWQWQTAQDTSRPSLLSTALREHSLAALAEGDEDRAALEAELQADQGGLQRHRRRQPRLAAQEAVVWRTDLAHHLLAWTRAWICRDSPWAEAGIDRRVNDLWPIPGKGVIDAGHSVTLRLKTAHPLAKPLLVCLARL